MFLCGFAVYLSKVLKSVSGRQKNILRGLKRSTFCKTELYVICLNYTWKCLKQFYQKYELVKYFLFFTQFFPINGLNDGHKYLNLGIRILNIFFNVIIISVNKK